MCCPGHFPDMSLVVTRIEVRNIRSIEHAVIDLDTDGITALIGHIGSGKSTILEAVAFANWGAPPPGVAQGELRRLGAEGDKAYAEVTQIIDGIEVRAVRGLTRKVSKGAVSEVAYAKLFLDGEQVAQITPSKLTAKMIELTGMTGRMFRSMQFIGQAQLPRLAEGTPGDIQSLIEELTGIDPLTRAIEAASKAAGKAEQAVRALPGDPDVLEEHQRALDDELYGIDALRGADRSAAGRSGDAARDAAGASRELSGLRARRDAAQRSVAEIAALTERRSSFAAALDDAESDLRALGPDPDDAADSGAAADMLRGLLRDAGLSEQAADDARRRSERAAAAAAAAWAAVPEPHDGEADPAVLALKAADLEAARSEHESTANRKAAQARSLLGAGSDPHCPTCQQPLPDAAELAADIGRLADRAAAAADALRPAIDRARAQLAEALAIREAGTASAVADQAESDLRDARTASSAARRLLSGALDLPEPTGASDLEAAAHARLIELAGIAARRQRASELGAKLAILRASLDSTDESIAQARRDTQDAPDDEALDRAAVAASKAGDEAAQAAAEAAAASTALSVAQARVDGAQAVRDAEAARLAAKAGAMSRAETGRASVTVLSALRRDLLADCTSLIADAASDLLSGMDCDHVAISLDETFIPRVIRADGASLPLAHLSGGEKYRAAMCLRLGITAAISGGGAMPMIFGDEITAAYDSGTRESVVSFLAGLGMPMVLVGHTDEIAAISSRTYEFSRRPGAGGSAVKRTA